MTAHSDVLACQSVQKIAATLKLFTVFGKYFETRKLFAVAFVILCLAYHPNKSAICAQHRGGLKIKRYRYPCQATFPGRLLTGAFSSRVGWCCWNTLG